MFKEYIKPLIVLTAICLVLSGALAAVNSVTEPVIASAAKERTDETIKSIIPDATGFEAIDLAAVGNVPATVKEAFKTQNDVGYIFIAAVSGYSGDITIICAIDNNGKIIDVSTLSHTETQGIGTVIEEESFLAPFVNADNNLAGVDTVTGATISTRAYIGAVRDVFEAFEIIKN